MGQIPLDCFVRFPGIGFGQMGRQTANLGRRHRSCAGLFGQVEEEPSSSLVCR